MNLEFNTPEIIQKERIISINDLTADFFNGQLDPELINWTIPKLIKNITDYVPSIQIGGTGAEIASGLSESNEYWHTKNQLQKLNSKIFDNIQPGPRSDLIISAFKTLSDGDPDFDLYVTDKKYLLHLYEVCKDLKISDKFKLISSYQSIYPGSLFYRTNFQIVDHQEKPLFHIDITVLPETGIDQVQNRRHFVDDIHDDCRGDLFIRNNQAKIKFDLDKIPQFNKPLSTKFQDKDITTIPEIAARVIRKEITINNSKKNLNRSDFNHKYFFSLMDAQSVFAIRELTFGPNSKIKELFNRQKPAQKETFFRECLLAGQKDPWQFIIFLQDTGLDTLIVGRHLTRYETLNLLSSEYLNFSPSSNNENLSQKIKKSRENYLNINGDDPKKNALESLISAIGQVFGDEKDRKDFELHFKKGLEILVDPENNVKPLEFLKSKYNIGSKKQEILEEINNGGGLTEKGLHHLLNQKNPKKYSLENETDQKKFGRILFELKKTGLIEAAKRTIRLSNGEEIESLFYYPCLNPTKISKILLQTDIPQNNAMKKILYRLNINTVEATLSLNEKDMSYLKDSSFWDEIVTTIGPNPALELVKWQIELIKLQQEVIGAGKIANYLDIPQFRKK